MFLLTNWNLSPCESEKKQARWQLEPWQTELKESSRLCQKSQVSPEWLGSLDTKKNNTGDTVNSMIFTQWVILRTKVCDPAISRFKTGVSNASRTKEWSLWPCPADGYMVSKWCRWVWLQWFWGWFWSDEFPVEVNGLTPISFQSTMLSKQHCKRPRYGHLVFNVSPRNLAWGEFKWLVQFDQICQQIWIPPPWINHMSCPTSF